MKQLLIGLAGRARTGKTSLAQHLTIEHDFQSYAFADPLREGLINVFNLTPSDFSDDKKEQPIGWLGRSPRELMQSMGTEWGRHMVHPELWLLLAEQNLTHLGQTYDTAPGFVISDVRFENEAEFIRKRGGIVIHVLRPGAPEVNPHLSERGVAIIDNDFVLHNDGSLEDLFSQMDQYLAAIVRRAAA